MKNVSKQYVKAKINKQVVTYESDENSVIISLFIRGCELSCKN